MNKRHNATWTYKTCPISISEVTDYETKWTAFYVHFSRIAKSVLVVAILSVRPSVRPSRPGTDPKQGKIEALCFYFMAT